MTTPRPTRCERRVGIGAALIFSALCWLLGLALAGYALIQLFL